MNECNNDKHLANNIYLKNQLKNSYLDQINYNNKRKQEDVIFI